MVLANSYLPKDDNSSMETFTNVLMIRRSNDKSYKTWSLYHPIQGILPTFPQLDFQSSYSSSNIHLSSYYLIRFSSESLLYWIPLSNDIRIHVNLDTIPSRFRFLLPRSKTSDPTLSSFIIMSIHGSSLCALIHVNLPFSGSSLNSVSTLVHWHIKLICWLWFKMVLEPISNPHSNLT